MLNLPCGDQQTESGLGGCEPFAPSGQGHSRLISGVPSNRPEGIDSNKPQPAPPSSAIHASKQSGWLMASLSIAIAALLSLSAEQAQAGDQARDLALPSHAGQPLAVIGFAQPTLAWVEFCNRLPAECEVDL